MPFDRNNLSDEQLNAFVDHQLDADEKSSILSAINGDEELSRRACELRRLRDLVQHAYDEPPAPPARQPRVRAGSWFGQGIAASLIMALGVTLGWFGHERAQEPALQAMYLDDEKAFQTASLSHEQAMASSRKFLLHVSSSDQLTLERALDTAERLLAEQKGHIDLEVVANAGGLNLLRADVSPFADRVRKLQLEYENLTFLACRSAMERLASERHLNPDLLPEALVTPNALEQILSRLQEGWVYISV